MSIPPLVCSTPPPPDQCEDYKEPEDFELSYNLSQDDEDYENNDYSYGNFTSYNRSQLPPDNLLEIKKQEIKDVKNLTPKEIVLQCEHIGEMEHNITSNNMFGTSDINENKLKCEDDINIEDLNLKVDKEMEVIESSIDQIEASEQNTDDEKVFSSPCNTGCDSPTGDTVNNTPPFDKSATNDCDLPEVLNPDLFISVPAKPLDSDVQVGVVPDVKSFDIDLQDNPISSITEFKEPVKLEEMIINCEDNKYFENINSRLEKNVLLDDDFDDFQSVDITSTVTSIVESNDNPWQNADCSESDFSNFTANFEEISFQNADLALAGSVMSNKPEYLESETRDLEDSQNLGDHDDFGDFDDFQSSCTKAEPTQCHELPEFNLQSTENEHQIMERIAKVLDSVFLEEISEPADEFEEKLESLLSETWVHLKETDERQPYIVNWNNSFGQKTLLRALCIDSRNILFGPKWSNNMPKYAANLSNAPLQPQKQASVPTSIITQSETVTATSSGTPTSWRDPFTSEGQESCNTETESAAITPSPTDLDVFDATIPTKPGKIFSNTIDVQPLRQINLPDTHIFTPTDSEIPRSKTIHYDHNPTVPLPRSTITHKDQTDTQDSLSTNRVFENNNEIDGSEYWEFQNFKSAGTSSLSSNIDSSQTILQEKRCEIATTVNALPQPSVAYQTELLQPIKVEPAMPTLNWPDPGEVKGVFDDFSDFVSISSHATQEQNNSALPAESPSRTDKNKPGITDAFDRILSESVTATNKFNKDDFDDDFDTFQSALSSKSKSDFSNNHSLDNAVNQTPLPVFVSETPKVESIKSDTISFTSIPRPKEALTKSIEYTNTKDFITNKNVLPLGSMLQPTLASSVNTQNQQKSGQILQPLSLESYSQINWPNPGIDLQDLSRFNPVESLQSFKCDLSVSGSNKGASPVHATQVSDDDGWGEFVSSKCKQSQTSQPKKPSDFVDDDEWTDFISSPSVQPQNGLNTISLNVHTNSNIHKSVPNKLTKKSNQLPIDIPTLNYITPKSNHHKSYNDKHFQNL